ncbi:response regulator [Rariglobus hedericola]|uniref:Response regulator n=1 Tax=Rariglobus hedericola TaxID=2597822 RepID=A0A556QK72_9BACT|nr:response regulator [Rariglobus hedericola]TSJ77029.1 response regulator [Rariglobus hedericola]
MVSPKLPPSSRILIADDSVVCRGVLVILLETAGYEVVSVLDGRQALDALRNHSFDLAILDNDMPNLDGLGALAELRAFLPSLPVLVCSGTITPDVAVRYRELGIDDLLNKPVDPRALRDKIAGIITRQNLSASASASPFRLPSFRGVRTAADKSLPCPLTQGMSKFALRLQADMDRLRDFRSVAILEGRHGSGRFELALSATNDPASHKFVAHADELTAARLDELLKPAHADTHSVLLVILEADRLLPEKQLLLEELVRGRLASQSTLSKRLRIILCAQSSLCDLHFNEFLLLRATTATFLVPDFVDRWQDWGDIARAILRRAGTGRGTFSTESIKWMDRQLWPGDYMQLHRTIELARRLAGVTSTLTEAHMATARAQEAECTDPLFHDMLFHLHSGGEA